MGREVWGVEEDETGGEGEGGVKFAVSRTLALAGCCLQQCRPCVLSTCHSSNASVQITPATLQVTVLQQVVSMCVRALGSWPLSFHCLPHDAPPPPSPNDLSAPLNSLFADRWRQGRRTSLNAYNG